MTSTEKTSHKTDDYTSIKGLKTNQTGDDETIRVSNEEISEKLWRDSRISQNFIVWTSFFIYPLFSALDFLYINHLWVEFLLFRFVLLAGLFVIFEIAGKKKATPALPIHLLMGGVTIQMIIFSVYAPLFAHYYYLTLLSVSTVFVMAVMIWQPAHSVGQVIFSVLVYFTAIILVSENTIDEYLQSGGIFYIGVIVLSAFISALRFEYQGKNARIEIYQEKYKEILQKEIRNIIIQRDDLASSKLSLEDMNVEKNRFINVASHSIKNPLTRIFGFLQIIPLEFTELPKELTDYLEIVEDSAHEINEVLDRYVNLKTFNKEPVMKLEPIDIIDIIQKSLRKFQSETVDRNISVKTEIHDSPVQILGDSLSLKQVLSSLIKYSIRLSYNNSEMKIITETEMGNVRVHITQSRTSIDIDRLNELFDSLEHLTKQQQNAMGGQGLGLSLAKVLTHNMNGHLYYSANPHSGIYFMLEFPLLEFQEPLST